MFIQIFTQGLQQSRIFGKTLHQDLTCTIQRCFGIGYTGIVTIGGGEGGLQISGCFGFRLQARVGEQGVGQRLQTGFHRDLCFSAALRFVRQVEIFQPGFIFRQADCSQQFRCHFALFINRGDDGCTAVFQFAQITQAFFQQT